MTSSSQYEGISLLWAQWFENMEILDQLLNDRTEKMEMLNQLTSCCVNAKDLSNNVLPLCTRKCHARYRLKINMH